MRKRKNIVEIRHAIPGRTRLKIHSALFNMKTANQLSVLFKGEEGVTAVRPNLRCGSLIIRYDPAILSKSELRDVAQAFFAETRCSDKLSVKDKNGNVAASRDSVRSALIRFIGMTVLTAIVFVREVILKRPFAQNLFSPLGIVTGIAALPLLRQGLESIRERRFTLESFLGGSIITAVAVGEATAALEILWITSGAELLKTWITERSRRAIRDILEITEKNTYILVKGVEVEIPVDDVKPGDIVVAHTGEKLAVDGFVTDGKAMLDESPINGRAELTLRQSGDRVFAGTFVRQGVIYVHAANVGDKTYLGRILQMVEDSLENKAPIEGVAEDLAARLIRIGFASTLITYLVTRSMWRAFTVLLVMACPCATILAASTAISAALSAAAKQHILIKGGRYLEEVGSANVVCFDKTGTLTTNTPELAELVNLSTVTDDTLLQIAYSAEKHNAHPVALAIKTEAEERNIEAIPHDVCDYTLGKGVRAEILGVEVLVGSEKLMASGLINMQKARRIVRKFKMQGLTIVYIARNKELMGLMGFANRNRPNIREVIRYLRNDGIQDVVMITGDEQCTAVELTRQLDMNECYYSVMPEDKSDIVNELRGNGHKILMVGDGINDALALAEADIGVAMGAGGSEVAIEAADIALVKDDLRGILYVRGLSHATMKVVHQNFWIATGSNIAGVILGAMGILSPVAAGLIHIVHTLGVLANSGRLLYYEAPLLPNEEPVVTSDVPEKKRDKNILDFESMKRIA